MTGVQTCALPILRAQAPVDEHGFVVYSRIATIFAMPSDVHLKNFEVDSIVERGHITVLTDDQAKPLFEIPPGFTESK